MSMTGDSSRTEELKPGTIVAERYEIVSQIGAGGMGLVYRVKQIFVQKDFAMKTLSRTHMSAIALRRFQQEAKTTFSIDHPSIVSVKDFGLIAGETPYLVMELLKGETLAERIKTKGKLTLDEAIPLFVQVCFGLAYAHDLGIVHRDVKPGNIMILLGVPSGADGSVKIVDFGIAKFVGHEGGEIQALTRTGEIFGSPLYMSPEQCSGYRVDHRSDIYSLGCVLFEALTGNPPFMGDNALSTMMKHQSEPPPTLKEGTLGESFPKEAEAIVQRMLAKQPAERYSSIGEVANALGALKRGDKSLQRSGGISTVGSASNANNGSLISRQPLIAIGAIAAILIVSIALFALGSGFFRPSPTTSATTVSTPAAPTSSNSAATAQGFGAENNKEADLFMEQVTARKGKEARSIEIRDQLEASRATHTLTLIDSKLTEKQFEAIGREAGLKKLVLRGCKFENSSLRHLTNLTQLKELVVAASSFNNEGAAWVGKCKSLDTLFADHTNIDDDGMHRLVALPRMTNLGLAHTWIADAGLAEIAKLPRLDALDVSEDKSITLDGLKQLTGKRLLSLELEGYPLDDAGLAIVATLPRVIQVNLCRTNITASALDRLCSKPSLRKVFSLGCPNITDEQLRVIKTKHPSIDFPIDDPRNL